MYVDNLDSMLDTIIFYVKDTQKNNNFLSESKDVTLVQLFVEDNISIYS